MAMQKTQTMDLEIIFIVTWDSPKQAKWNHWLNLHDKKGFKNVQNPYLKDYLKDVTTKWKSIFKNPHKIPSLNQRELSQMLEPKKHVLFQAFPNC